MDHALVMGPDPDLADLKCTCGERFTGANAVDRIIRHIAEADDAS